MMSKGTETRMNEVTEIAWCTLSSTAYNVLMVKPRSHSAGMAPVHPDGGQPVYRDEPGHFS